MAQRRCVTHFRLTHTVQTPLLQVDVTLTAPDPRTGRRAVAGEAGEVGTAGGRSGGVDDGIVPARAEGVGVSAPGPTLAEGAGVGPAAPGPATT
jgi:hypothetical protein